MSRETVLFIMPVYNEEKNIGSTIEKWVPVVKSVPGSTLLIINDGSTDNTAALLKKIKNKYKLLQVINKKNEGHGKTIRLGYELAVNYKKHTWVFQTDSDGHFLPSDFYKLWDKRKTSPFILGHRLRRDDNLGRKTLSKIIRIWVYILFNTNIKDPNIPFRLIKVGYLRQILPKVKNNVFAPNIHLSILAAKDTHNLYHIPVNHTNTNKKK